MRNNINFIVLLAFTLWGLSGCKPFESLEPNPNVASADAAVPPSLLLGRITFDLYAGPGYADGLAGRVLRRPLGSGDALEPVYYLEQSLLRR